MDVNQNTVLYRLSDVDVGGVLRRLCLILIVGVFISACSALLPDHVSFTGINANLRRGSDHCGWDGTWYVVVDPWEIRSHVFGDQDDLFNGAIDPSGSFVYVRDPEEIPEYVFKVSSSLEASLPEDAVMIGDSNSGHELWIDPLDAHHVYVVTGSTVEAWALAIGMTGCD